MADVEKININGTDYDIADAKALRDKNVNASSFIDTRAGTTTYPTDNVNLTECLIIGKGAYNTNPTGASWNVVVGNAAKSGNGSFQTIIGSKAICGDQNYIVAVGYNANASAQNSIAIGTDSQANGSYDVIIGSNARGNGESGVAAGESSIVGNNSVAVGKSSSASIAYSISVGYMARTQASYSIALGAQSYASASYTTATGANTSASFQYSSVYGFGATASNIGAAAIGAYANAGYYSTAVGYNAKTTNSFCVQLGQGTNADYGTLQFRDWQLVSGNGKIPEERLPDGIKTATPRFLNLYEIANNNVSETAILYTGPTNDSYKNSQFYCGRMREGYPIFNCSWVDNEWLDSQSDVMIDQQKLFIKLAEVTKQRIDDDDIENGLIGGDNAEQAIYLYYDADNDYYLLRFDSDGFEAAFNHAPDDITGLSFDDLADYGIYFRNFHKPSDLEGEYEICDIYYYAPVYIDSYEWNTNPSYIDYFTFLSALIDSDWGIGYVIPDMNRWSFEIDGNTYWVPILPEYYEWNGDEYDGMELRWEWDSSGEGSWAQYINGEDINRSWSTADLYDTFGIYVEPGEEENVEYINLYIRGGVQRYWNQFDPVDSANFCTKQEKQDIQSEITALQNKSFSLIQTATNLNNLTTSGAYHIQATGCTNLPSTASASRDMFLFVTSIDANNVKQVLITDYVRKEYDNENYGTYCSNMYVRTLSGGTWRPWQVILTPDDLMFLPGFDKTKKQVIGHTADLTNIVWMDA